MSHDRGIHHLFIQGSCGTKLANFLVEIEIPINYYIIRTKKNNNLSNKKGKILSLCKSVFSSPNSSVTNYSADKAEFLLIMYML